MGKQNNHQHSFGDKRNKDNVLIKEDFTPDKHAKSLENIQSLQRQSMPI